MIKKWYFYTSLIVVVAFLSLGFKPSKLESTPWFLINETDDTSYLLPSLNVSDYTNSEIPYTGTFFIGYKEAIGFKESQGKYRKINSLGYLGKYQFGIETLKTIGVHNCDAFLNSPKMQEKAFIALLSKNKWELRGIIEKYEGTVLNGIHITESGILAAAHLAGVGSVKKFFRYKGKRFIKDAYGTSLRSYLRRFGGYDTSFIVPDSTAKVKF
ncbi:peptidoglycan-binding protein LysM [Flavobacterium sp. A45]|uniref:peptidoglycan-binding protein LysM n=1 Tax=Flavobacterium sp. A45 TaxID=1945862 RepID=UPI0009867FC2|nr:peptidoglycan-binding protein LysM [Flavobacterium sp. A45]OOG78808.1 peptidoglycan-binding protein LysM [Flavobacterium sp. A45]